MWLKVSTGGLTWRRGGGGGGGGGPSWLIQGISPRAVAPSANACQIAAVPPAALMPSDAARFAMMAATALPRATPAAMSLGEARPERSAACCCSAALALISSTDVGKRRVNRAALTPASTASSDGYDGTLVVGISDLILLSTFEGEGRMYAH